MVNLVEELCGVQDILWNLEQLIVFQMVILQQSRHVTASHAILRSTKKRIAAWEAGLHENLAKENLRTCAQYLTAAHRD